jgi:hypothetical protein
LPELPIGGPRRGQKARVGDVLLILSFHFYRHVACQLMIRPSGTAPFKGPNLFNLVEAFPDELSSRHPLGRAKNGAAAAVAVAAFAYQQRQDGMGFPLAGLSVDDAYCIECGGNPFVCCRPKGFLAPTTKLQEARAYAQRSL